MEDLKLNKRPRSPEFESFYNMISGHELYDVWEDAYEMSQLEDGVYAVTGGIAWETNAVCDKQL